MSENDAAFHRSDLASAKRIVVKVGSSLLTSLEAGLSTRRDWPVLPRNCRAHGGRQRGHYGFFGLNR